MTRLLGEGGCVGRLVHGGPARDRQGDAQIPRLLCAKPADVESAPRLDFEVPVQPRPGLPADEYAPHLALVFKPGSQVDRVAPYVIAQARRTDHACHHRAAGNAHTDCQHHIPRFAHLVGDLQHGAAHVRHAHGVICRRLRHAGYGHVGIADGLDLFHAVLGGEPVEAMGQLVQQCHGPLRAK